MLIDSKGRQYDPNKLPKGRENRTRREGILAGLRELLIPAPPKHGTMFNLGERARLKQ